ncbi:MAG: hypothetical protein ACRDHI_09485 [Actinomycetota bacterium]
MSSSRDVRRGRGVAVAAIVVVAGVLVHYLSVIASQSTRELARVGFVVLLFLAVLACIAGTLILDSASTRGVVGAGAAGLLLSMSYLALFSIGLLLLVGAVLAIVWLVRTRSERRDSSPIPTIAAFVVGAILPWSLLLQG